MSWSMYEPAQSMAPSIPALGQMPSQFAVRPAGMETQNPETKNVQIPQTVPTTKPSIWSDISDYGEVSDFLYIGMAVLIVDVLFLFLIRYFPDVFGKSINVWYNRFKLSAVLADVGIIVIGFGIARYIYSEFIYPHYDWNALYFTATALVTQIVHDVAFYFGVVRPIPAGHNAMIDIFKMYAEEVGVRSVAADSTMMIASSGLSMILKTTSPHITAMVGLIGLYCLPYILETRNKYSVIS